MYVICIQAYLNRSAQDAYTYNRKLWTFLEKKKFSQNNDIFKLSYKTEINCVSEGKQK